MLRTRTVMRKVDVTLEVGISPSRGKSKEKEIIDSIRLGRRTKRALKRRSRKC